MLFIRSMNWLVLLIINCLRVQSIKHEPDSNYENRSLAFVFDTTASMKVDYNQFKNEVLKTMIHIWERNDIDVKHFVFVPFNDPGKIQIKMFV